jgi:hypothetical protein
MPVSITLNTMESIMFKTYQLAMFMKKKIITIYLDLLIATIFYSCVSPLFHATLAIYDLDEHPQLPQWSIAVIHCTEASLPVQHQVWDT